MSGAQEGRFALQRGILEAGSAQGADINGQEGLGRPAGGIMGAWRWSWIWSARSCGCCVRA